MFHRILVGVDDSDGARRALERAVELATEGHGRLGLLTSAPEPPCVIATSPVVPPASRTQLRAETERWAQRCVDGATDLVPQEIPVTKLVTHGDPAAALRREADSGKWDLVVVGQSSTRFRLFRPLGARLAGCATPVLVVHDQPAGAPERPSATAPRTSKTPARAVPAKGV